MTGFARRDGALADWSWAVEARSVNGRNLEIRFRAPPGFEALERPVREAAQKRFSRGQLGVTLQVRRAEAAVQTRVVQDLLDQYLAVTAELVRSGKASAPTADGLLALRGVIETNEASEDPKARAELEMAISRDIEATLEGLAGTRAEEGEALDALLGGFLDQVERLTDAAHAAAEAQGPSIRERFARRLQELLGEAAPADRILQEAAVMAARADVREEVDRLAAHVSAARALLAEPSAAGRRLDFLAQEFMREANTLTAKSATAALTAAGLELKAVIDRFREQVQNVE